ncbi:hypothetical protein COJ30_29245 [Bacillus anthracis]|uniref:Uncharacterized protein n=1 Tax=Bacillus anthracis TaxID=1392 RepID=A0A2B0W8E3_BACAN|nr:hypothetical protein COJ30_29245 [Bacillus anthracis]
MLFIHISKRILNDSKFVDSYYRIIRRENRKLFKLLYIKKTEKIRRDFKNRKEEYFKIPI